MLLYGVSTITHAQMGVSVLYKSGVHATVERNRVSKEGCGFILAVHSRDPAAVEGILRRGGIAAKRL